MMTLLGRLVVESDAAADDMEDDVEASAAVDNEDARRYSGVILSNRPSGAVGGWWCILM